MITENLGSGVTQNPPLPLNSSVTLGKSSKFKVMISAAAVLKGRCEN